MLGAVSVASISFFECRMADPGTSGGLVGATAGDFAASEGALQIREPPSLAAPRAVLRVCRFPGGVEPDIDVGRFPMPASCFVFRGVWGMLSRGRQLLKFN